MSLSEALEHLLPIPSARWSVLLTGGLLTPAFLAPPFLKPLLWPTATDTELLLLQLLTTILVLLIGSLVTLTFVVHAYNDQTNRHVAELARQRKELTDTAAANKKRQDEFLKPIQYDHRGIV